MKTEKPGGFERTILSLYDWIHMVSWALGNDHAQAKLHADINNNLIALALAYVCWCFTGRIWHEHAR